MKILIVDDDSNTVERIRNALDYENCGVTQILSEYSGTAAYETIEREMPEIILSDIEMPGMDGMELLQKVSLLYDNMPEFVILSCHNEFSYAQQAIRYGVRDFLTKPFEQDELIAVISKAVVEAGKKQQTSVAKHSVATQKNHDSFLLNTFFYQILQKTFTGDSERIRRYLLENNIPLNYDTKFYCCALEAVVSKTLDEDTAADYLFPIRNIAAEVMYDCIDYTYVITISSEIRVRVILLLPEEKFSKEDIRERCYHLTDVLKKYLSLNVMCMVSPVTSLWDLSDVGESLWNSLHHNMTLTSPVMFLDEIPVMEGKETYFPSLEARTLIGFLEEKQKVSLIVCIRNEIQKADRDKQLTSGFMLLLHHEILQAFYGFLANSHVQAAALFNNPVYQRLHSVAETSPINMIKYVDYVYDLTMRKIDEVRESGSLVVKTKAYIDEHFREDISRDDISDYVCVSPNYLSKVWKKSTGSMLREYINECRIREAKNLMSTTDLNGNEIAIRVGFGNTTYFSSTFKKITGLTPSEWKQQNVGNENS